MAFWSRKRWLKEGGSDVPPVTPWNGARVEAAGYRLSVGGEYFVSGDGSSTIQNLPEAGAFVLAPGQFAFILTKERVHVPKNAIGFISLRVSFKFLGIVNVSGFQVNPGFRGNLVFAVFNAGQRHITLRNGDEIFSVWIADLDDEVSAEYEEGGNIPNDLDKIPSTLISGVTGEMVTAYQAYEKAKSIGDVLESLRREVAETKTLFIRSLLVLGGIAALVSFLAFKSQIGDFLSGNPSKQSEQNQTTESSDEVPLED